MLYLTRGNVLFRTNNQFSCSQWGTWSMYLLTPNKAKHKLKTTSFLEKTTASQISYMWETEIYVRHIDYSSSLKMRAREKQIQQDSEP